jgi:hypothetical protein
VTHLEELFNGNLDLLTDEEFDKYFRHNGVIEGIWIEG